MEFWGVEVKPGEHLKVKPQPGKLIHISQAALGEAKDVKGTKHVPLRLKIDAKKFILGTLSTGERTQLLFDFVFEREFELSHDWKNGSVYFVGYSADDSVSDAEDFPSELDESSEEEPLDARENSNTKTQTHVAEVAKKAKAAVAAVNPKVNKVGQPSSDGDEEDSDSDSDDEMVLDVSADDSEDDSDESLSSEEELPKQGKKRPAKSAPTAPLPAKKAKPALSGNTKGGEAKPFPTKKPGKNPIINKSKDKNQNSGGGRKARK